MNHLHRELAPISSVAWNTVDDEASRVLRQHLAGRRVVDYFESGDWTTCAVGTGRVDVAEPVEGAPGARLTTRVVQPLVELRVDFTLTRAELDAVDRGAKDMDTDPVIRAAISAAAAEDALVFHGRTGEPGIANSASSLDVPNAQGIVPAVAQAVETLRTHGVDGPHALALGPRLWTTVMGGSDAGGYPLASHLGLVFDGPVVWAPVLSGALLVSQRTGDFSLTVGQDWAIGYEGHDTEGVHLYLQASLAFQVFTPHAAVEIVVPAT